MIIQEETKLDGPGHIGAYAVERILTRALPRLRAELANLSPSREREMLAELLECIALLGGCSAEGARRAQEAAMSDWRP
jgi:hypothetical protein